MFDQIKAIDISQKSLITSIFIALGLNNITTVSNCMSRVRITVHDPSLLADDSVFLDHQAKGVIKEGDSIHLIYGRHSILIAQQLKILIDILNTPSIIGLVKSFHGIKYINRITHEKNQIIIYFHPAPHIQNISTTDLKNKFDLDCSIYNDSMEINGSDELLTQLQYTILYWDLIQSVFMFNIIPMNNIKNITHHSYDFHITLNNPTTYNVDDWIEMGLFIESNSIDSKELIISDCSDDLFTTYLEYYNFFKK